MRIGDGRFRSCSDHATRMSSERPSPSGLNREGCLATGESVGASWQPTGERDRLQLAARPNSEDADIVCAGVEHEQKASVLRQREIGRRAARTGVRAGRAICERLQQQGHEALTTHLLADDVDAPESR